MKYDQIFNPNLISTFSWHSLFSVTVVYMYTLSSMIRRKLNENLLPHAHVQKAKSEIKFSFGVLSLKGPKYLKNKY